MYEYPVQQQLAVRHTESLFTKDSDISSRGQVVHCCGLGSTSWSDEGTGVDSTQPLTLNLTPTRSQNGLKRARNAAAPLSIFFFFFRTFGPRISPSHY